jgi:uncharacterized protein
MNATITLEKLDHYLALTAKALELVKKADMDALRLKDAKIFLDMAQRYFDDALHFKSKNDFVLAYGAVYYAHAWLDAGAMIGLFKVKDNSLFMVD